MMYSCLHCEVVNFNRNSFNRHLREHLGTDVIFLKKNIGEEEKKATLEKTDEREETDGMEQELHQMSGTDLQYLFI